MEGQLGNSPTTFGATGSGTRFGAVEFIVITFAYEPCSTALYCVPKPFCEYNAPYEGFCRPPRWATSLGILVAMKLCA